jgi:hypothetical protein
MKKIKGWYICKIKSRVVPLLSKGQAFDCVIEANPATINPSPVKIKIIEARFPATSIHPLPSGVLMQTLEVILQMYRPFSKTQIANY